MECLICQSKNLKQIEITKISRIGHRCDNCSFIFLWPQPTPKEIEDIYKKSYYKSWGVFTGMEKTETIILKKEISNRFLNKIMLRKNSGKILDIGSAFGYFMDKAVERGFDAYGVELSNFSSAIAKKRFGSKVFNGKLENARFPDGYFDIITMFDLIEHIPEPVEFMKEVKRIIKPGGFIAITTPDTSSPSFKLLGYGQWFHWKFEHLSYFNKKSIKELSKQTGFSLVEKKRAYKTMSFQYIFDQFRIFPQPIIGSFVNLLNKVISKSIRHKTFPISGGEMFIILKTN